MFTNPELLRSLSSLTLTSAVVDALRRVQSYEELAGLVQAVTFEMGFRYYALIHHDDLRDQRPDRVDLKDYPAAIVDRLIGEAKYRRDPVIRGCLYSAQAFLWSELDRYIQLDRRDRECFELGVQQGLNEGITVPYVRLGDCMGSCTFAGSAAPDVACRYLGAAQMIGVFAFQAALRLLDRPSAMPANPPRLHPRPRDCVVLAGRGLSNKEIARALGLTPRTVDGYLTQARKLFRAHDRTELVVSAVLAGEIGLDELGTRQPE